MELRTETIETIRVVYLRGFGPYWETFPKIWPRVRAYAQRHGLAKESTLFLSVSHHNPRTTSPDQIVGDACFSVPVDFKLPDDPTEPDMAVQNITGGRYAIGRYRGPYQGLSDAWGQFMAATKQPAFKSRPGYPFEIYRTDSRTTPPDKTVTDLFTPIETE